jgi:hypothetical protein
MSTLQDSNLMKTTEPLRVTPLPSVSITSSPSLASPCKADKAFVLETAIPGILLSPNRRCEKLPQELEICRKKEYETVYMEGHSFSSQLLNYMPLLSSTPPPPLIISCDEGGKRMGQDLGKGL